MFNLELVNRNDNSLDKPILIYPSSDIDDLLAAVYHGAFREELEQEPGLISRTFRATPSHEISEVLLAELRQRVQAKFAVHQVGDSIKFIDKGHEAKLNVKDRGR